MRRNLPVRLLVVLLPFWLLAGCGGGSSGGGEPSPDSVERTLSRLIAQQGLAGDPADGAVPVTPDADPRVRLGEALFFARAMSIGFETSCASCHHPRFASGDGLSLPVGVAAEIQHTLGPGRLIDPAKDRSPLADGGPDVPRNSQPVFNVGIYKQRLFWDGRVQLLADGLPDPDGIPAIKTPESGNSADPQAGSSLLAAQARFPIVSGDEMRGFGHADLPATADVRDRLLRRLKGQVDSERISAADAAAWLALFRAAFNQPSATADEVITMAHVQEALAAYQRGQLFVDTPWNRYLRGDPLAVDDQVKRGAVLFFGSRSDGGLGCGGCHAGDHLTDENFYNVGFPQFGHGKRPDHRDFGRYDFSHREEDRYAFRVPSLINVALTGPWGHVGAFDDLGELLDYHVDPQRMVDVYDFTLASLDQFSDLDVDYPHAEGFTREAIQAAGFAGNLLPRRALSDEERAALLAFLEAQTDMQLAAYVRTGSCITGTSPCPDLWIPGGGDEVDGSTLFIGVASADDVLPLPADNATGVTAKTMLIPFLGTLTEFPDIAGCASGPSAKANSGAHVFVERAAALGISHRHGYDHDTWMSSLGLWFESLMMHGGVSGAYVDADCWPDLLFAGGDWGGAAAYRNVGGTSFVTADWLQAIPETGAAQIATFGIADLDGDYRREIVAGLTRNSGAAVLAPGAADEFSLAASLQSSRNIYGIAFGDYDNNGYPDVLLAHWGIGGLPGTAPIFWENQGGTVLAPLDRRVTVSAADGINQLLLFAPAFTDYDADGWLDLLIAGDFGTSLVLHNEERSDGGRRFANVTDRDEITDENGMGSALGDYDNDGDLDWFVSSIDDPNDFAEGAWGLTGNKLYRNDAGVLRDVSAAAGIADGRWGWGSCFADFDNDGWLDIFHENGFGYLPEEIRALDTGYRIDGYRIMAAEFIDTRPRLFLNNRDGTFREVGQSWGLLPGNGRGVVCMDYDRDGDVDIAVAGNSVTPKLYENQSGRSGAAFASVRLVGLPPNTDALGARVQLSADLNGNGRLAANESQLRVQSANSNFASQDPPVMHFGLADAGIVAQLQVDWPDGTRTTCSGLQVNRHYVVSRRTSTCE